MHLGEWEMGGGTAWPCTAAGELWQGVYPGGSSRLLVTQYLREVTCRTQVTLSHEMHLHVDVHELP